MSELSPSYDNKIERKYSMKTLDQKNKNKISLQRELGWPAEPKMPMLCIPGDVTEKEHKLLEKLLPGIDSLNIQLLVLKKGSANHIKDIEKRAKEHKHRIAVLKDDDEHVRKMLAAADIGLFLGSPEKDPMLANCLRYGTVPVCPECDNVENYNAIQESGNAFTYEGTSEWHSFAGIVRALETFKFPYDWRTIQRNCMDKEKASE